MGAEFASLLCCLGYAERRTLSGLGGGEIRRDDGGMEGASGSRTESVPRGAANLRAGTRREDLLRAPKASPARSPFEHASLFLP